VGTELLIGVVLGFVVLGPRRMQSMLGNLGRAKTHFDKATRELKSQLTAELERSPSILNQKQSLSPRDCAGVDGSSV
jgi:Sec-independent protein translocase protein TatA